MRTRSLFYRCALPSHRLFRFNMFKCATVTIPAPQAQPNTSTVELLSSGTRSLTSLCTTRTNTSSHVVKCDRPKLHYAFPRINAVRGWIHYPTDNSCTSRRVQLGRKYRLVDAHAILAAWGPTICGARELISSSTISKASHTFFEG